MPVRTRHVLAGTTRRTWYARAFRATRPAVLALWSVGVLAWGAIGLATVFRPSPASGRTSAVAASAEPWRRQDVVRRPRLRFIAWGPAWGQRRPGSLLDHLDGFGRALQGSGWSAVLAAQRGDNGAIGPLRYSGLTSDPARVPASVSAEAMGREIDRVARRHGWKADPSTMYVVFTSGSTLANTARDVCGYHRAVLSGGRWYNASIVPWMKGCATSLPGLDRVVSHEVAEAADDPTGRNPAGEIGDPCNGAASVAIGVSWDLPYAVQPIRAASGACRAGRNTVGLPALASLETLGAALRNPGKGTAFVGLDEATASAVRSRSFRRRLIHTPDATTGASVSTLRTSAPALG